MAGEAKAFFSYSRQDGEFALRLAKDLRDRGAVIWMDQLDIPPGSHWDEYVEKAVGDCSIMLVVLSPHSTESENVMDEVAYALDEKKVIIPVMFTECKVPFRLRRMQYVDVRPSYEKGLQEILKALNVAQRTADVLESARRVQAEQAAREKAQADAAKAQAQQQVARQRQPPPLSALNATVQPKSRKVLWVVLGLFGGLVLLGGIISAINDSQRNQEKRSESYQEVPDTHRAAAPSDPSPEPTPRTTNSDDSNRQGLQEWLNGLIEASQGPSVTNLLPYYSATVSPYFSIPNASWPQIAADKQAYFNRFPQVQYELVSWRHTPRPDGSEEIYYSVRYTAIRKDGVIANGTSYVGMVVRKEDGQWKIVGIQERTGA